MSGPICIKTAAESLSLEEGFGEALFTVSNVLSHPVRYRAEVKALPPTLETWLCLDGDAEREFEPNQTRYFRVCVVVPDGSPVERYSFRLILKPVGRTDEEPVEGPPVVFDYTPPPPPPPFPWWVLAITAGPLLILAVLAWLYLPH